jgi:lysophospholipase L1-like esterase
LVVLAKIAGSLDCPFFDTGSVVAASRVDGVHLDADSHQTLAKALVEIVAPLLKRENFGHR